MKEEKSSLILRKWSKQLFLPLFLKSGLTPNQITTINFFVTVLPSVYFFGIGENLIALIFVLINIPIDFIDGEIAKATGKFSKLGIWLDTSFDWIWQLAILGAVTNHLNAHIGILAIIMVSLSNYVSANSSLQLDDFPFVMKYYIFFGALFNQMKLILYIITIVYTIKFLITGYYSIKERNVNGTH